MFLPHRSLILMHQMFRSLILMRMLCYLYYSLFQNLTSTFRKLCRRYL